MSQQKPSKLSLKPGTNNQPVNPDSWVESRNGNDETLEPTPTKRITFEVTEQQHRDTKSLAAQKGMTIKELMQSLLVTELNRDR